MPWDAAWRSSTLKESLRIAQGTDVWRAANAAAVHRAEHLNVADRVQAEALGDAGEARRWGLNLGRLRPPPVKVQVIPPKSRDQELYERRQRRQWADA